MICNRCYYERPSFSRRQSPSCRDSLILSTARPFSPLRSYIGGSYCHSKGGRNESPKYLGASVARPESILTAQIRGSSTSFIILANEIKGFNYERLRRISRHEGYVLIDLDRYFSLYVRECDPLCDALFGENFSGTRKERDSS